MPAAGMQVGPVCRPTEADTAAGSLKTKSHSNHGPGGPPRGMKLAAPSSLTSSIGISELQLYFRRALGRNGKASALDLSC